MSWAMDNGGVPPPTTSGAYTPAPGTDIGSVSGSGSGGGAYVPPPGTDIGSAGAGTGSGAGYKQFPSKAYIPPELPSAQDLYEVTSENGQVLPIAFGVVRIAPNIIERGTPVQLISAYATGDKANAVPWWQPYTAYHLGDCVQTDGGDRNGGVPNFYVCTQAGTSGSGVTTTYIFNGHPATVTDGTCIWAFIGTAQMWLLPMVAALCEGPIVGAGKAWLDKAVFAQWNGSPGLGALQDWKTLALGTVPQTRPAWAAWNSYIDTYGNTAALWWYASGNQSNAVPQVSLEVQADSTDANPADIASTLITHTRKGAGKPSSWLFPASFDGSAASWHTYCQAAGLTVSWLIDSQSSVLQHLGVLCTATQTDMVVSGGQFKFVPRCDTAITGNGVTFTPQTAPVYDLGPDDLLAPLGTSRVSSTDTFNSYPVEYYDRGRDYGRVTVDDPDMSDVDVRGYKPAGSTSIPMVLSQGHAIWLSRTLAQRSLNCRNSYSLRLTGWRYCLLEPTDALTVTDPVLNVSRAPIRITELEETLEADGSSVITIGAEDYPAAAHSPAMYGTEVGDGYKPNTDNSFNSIVIGSAQIGGGTVPVDRLTAGATDNLWPNPTSEQEPPFGADTTGAEFGCRYNASTTWAYAGSWVRQIVGGSTSTGGVLGASNETDLGITVPCAPGDSFYLSAQTKSVSGGDLTCGIWGYFLDGSGNKIASGEGGASNTTGDGTWLPLSVSLTAPAGAVAARLYLFAHNGVTAQFDAIYARRVVDRSIIAPASWSLVSPITGPEWSSAYGGSDPAYAIDAAGNVHLRGIFSCSSATMSPTHDIANMPAGFRPSVTRTFPISYGMSSRYGFSNAGTAFLSIDASGNMNITNANGQWFASYFYVDGVVYQAEQ